MLSAEHNIQVTQPTTPAQYFHLLRRQMVRKWRKPLIVLTPKSLLRHPRVVSDLQEFSDGSFQRLIPDDRGPEAAAKTKRILICSGKVYYDLWKERKDGGLTDEVAILRLEQLYPLPEQELKAELAKYPEAAETIWVQEEPQNMGAWWSLRIRLGEKLFGLREWRLASRPESASPSTGSMDMHKLEQKELLEAALHG
jgi:2-oxoglutarate dehydrogenase E1 component